MSVNDTANTMILAVSPSDVDGIANFQFSDSFVDTTRGLAVVVVAVWILWMAKDYILPSNQPQMGLMGNQRGGGWKMALSAASIMLLVEPSLINAAIEGFLKTIIYIFSFIPGLNEYFTSDATGTNGDGGGSYE